MSSSAIQCTVVESNLRSRAGDPASSEDALYVGEHFIAVIDGATTKSEVKWKEGTPGRIAAMLVWKALGNLEPDATFGQAVSELTRSLYDFYLDHDVVEHMRITSTDRPSAATVVFSKKHRQLWLIGDCQALVNGQYYENPHIIDQILGDARRAFLTAELIKGAPLSSLLTSDPSRTAITPFLRSQCYFQNNPAAGDLCYSCVDGFDVDLNTTKVVQLGPDALEIVLASDGYPKLFPTLRKSEEHLSAQLEADPLMMGKDGSTKGKYYNQESFDDRCYVRFRVPASVAE